MIQIHSLRLRMMIAVSVLAIAAVFAVALTARQRTRSEFRRFQELQNAAASPLPEGDEAEVARLLMSSCCEEGALRRAAEVLSMDKVYVLVDAANQVVAKAGKPFEGMGEFHLTRNGKDISIDTTGRIRESDPDISLRLHTAGIPIHTTKNGILDLYVFPLPVGKINKPASIFLGSVDRSLLLATALIAAIVLLATWTLTRRIAGPVEELRRAARELAKGDLAQRVDIQGSDEISELSRSFNAMASELENQQNLRRNLVHDVVHELRTPLTALRCRLDSISDGVSTDPVGDIEGANEEISHLTRLVEDLHEVALAEARELTLNTSNELLGPIVISATHAVGLEADPRLRIAVGEDIQVHVDAGRLRQVMINLLSNAARHTPPEGAVAVSAKRIHNEVVVEVCNTGSFLSEHDLIHVFDRFYRSDPSRERLSGGTGLGLAVVKHLIEAQAGRVWVCSDDGGVRFSFAIPGDTSKKV